MIPEGWLKESVLFFGDVCAGRQRSPSFTDGEVRSYLRVANVFDGYIDTSNVNQMLFTEKEFSKYKLEEGDILLNEGQSTELVGRPAMYAGEPQDCCFQNTLIRFKANAWTDKNYALQRFRLCLYDGTFQVISKKTTSIAHLGVSRFANLALAWPPIGEQTKIAQILSTWDQAIATTEKLIENSKAQKKALMQQLLTGKKRLPGFSGEWKSTAISEIISESRISGSTGENARKLTIKLYGKGVVAKRQARKGSDSTKYFTRQTGQFIYSKLDFLNGAFGINPEHLEGYESTLDLPAFDFKTGVDPNWFLYFVSRKGFYSANLGLANGGRKARRVNPKDLLKLNISCPNHEEQSVIADVLSTSDQETENFRSQLFCLKL